jgi:hypothetical protein
MALNIDDALKNVAEYLESLEKKELTPVKNSDDKK